MRVTERNEPKFLLQRVIEITEKSFRDDELPPRGILTEQFMDGTVFIDSGDVKSYAIVSEKFGERYIWAIATHPDHRGRGLAGELLDEIEAWARENKAPSLTLTTHSDNPAQKLYFDKGYRVTRVLQDYYQTGNGLFMRRKLL